MDRVLEIGGYAAGYAGRLFVHAGADVVRQVGVREPAWASAAGMDSFLHAGKRRVVIDDAPLLQRLAQQADVVVVHAENAQAVDALGVLDWPGAIKVIVTSFGLTGPKKNWRATPNVLLAMGGYTNLTGDAEREPLTLPGHYVEFQSGALVYAAANAARMRGDTDTLIDISKLETLMTLSQFTTVRWHCAGEIRGRHGSDFWFVEPSELYRCADGWIYVNIVPQFWDPFTVFLDRPELAVDARFTDNDLRRRNRAALHAIAREAVADRGLAELERRADECRVPVGFVKTLSDVLAEPHLSEREFWYDVHVDGQTIRMPGTPYRINQSLHPDLAVAPMLPASEEVVWD